MSGKIEFGCDYIYIMLNIAVLTTLEGFQWVCIMMQRLFLVEWGISTDEFKEIYSIFEARLKSNQLDPELSTVTNRMINYLKNDKAAVERFITEMSAISYMISTLAEKAKKYIYLYRDALDIRPSEFENFVAKGKSLALGLTFFGQKYIEHHKPTA
jgi:hypothetical protein